jgi:hypothetical protein
MPRAGRRPGGGGLWAAAAALCLAAAPLAAQVRDPAPRPPAPADTLPRDTLPGDTTSAADAERERARAAAAADSIYQALLRRPGYTPMEYRGDSASFRAAERVLRLYGPAEVVRAGDRLTAEDTIVYREANRLVEAYGRPTISGQVMFYDLATRRATVRGGRTQVAEAGATWFVAGDVTAEGTDRLYATRSIFTTDDREEPAYYFQADHIKVIRDRILVGRPARLYFRNVPVFWLPFVFQDLTRGRRSGLVTPEFSINDIVRTSSTGGFERGTGRQIRNLGFYWAMSEYMDAQLTGGWRSGDYTSLTGVLRYRWLRQFLDGNVTFDHYWRETGARDLRLFAFSSWRPDERTSVSLNANYSSSSQLVRDITFDWRATQNLGSSFKLNRRFDWGTLDLGANRQQALVNDQVTTELPSVGIVLQPITFFRAATPEAQRWYSNATLSLSGAGSRGTTRFGADAPPGARDEDRTQMRVNQSFTMGNLGLSSNLNLNRTLRPAVPPVGDLPGLPRLDDDRGAWQANLSYRVGLIGETSLSPTLSLSQELRRDSLTADSYVGSPTRLGLGASLSTSLYGFLPGFGPFTAIRHKISPSFSYRYVPQTELTAEQERLFGAGERFAQNNLSLLSLSQTFEAKLREEPRPPARARAPGDTIAADTLAADTAALQPTPAEPRKVTILSINTSGFNYDFERARRGQSGFTTRQVTNTVSSDYLRGLQFTMTHDLFDPTGVEDPATELGRFRPRLSALSTQFSFGEDSPLLRFLGFGRREARQQAEAQTDTIPTQQPVTDPLDPMRRGNPFTNNPQAVGRGPWSVDVGYTYSRPQGAGGATQDIRLGMRFSPTANWAVSWDTNYSVEAGEFGGHSLTLRRDLYRWEANFGFYRSPYGNTSFNVLVRLKDLPDLKVDYREYNIGANRR